MTTSRNNTIMSWMAYTDFLSRLRIAAGILLPLNTRTLLLYPGGRDCIGAAGVDAYGLTARQLVCSLLAVGTAVGLYFALRGVLDRETLGWLCIVGATPMAAAGFFHYNGLTLEQFLWAWCKTNFLLAGRRLWHSENYLYDLWEKEDQK